MSKTRRWLVTEERGTRSKEMLSDKNAKWKHKLDEEEGMSQVPDAVSGLKGTRDKAGDASLVYMLGKGEAIASQCLEG